MARPWQSNVCDHRIPDSFKAAGIGMIVNLQVSCVQQDAISKGSSIWQDCKVAWLHVQEVGEHAHCGKGNLPHTGFSYDPESFMAVGIGVYNFSWRDMGVPTFHKMLDIVQVRHVFV